MTTVLNGPSLYGGPEMGRRVIGFLLELAFKAYGAAAAVSVAFSDAETVGGKLHDALAGVPNLTEHYRDMKYAVDHREEIQTALDYVRQHAPDPEQLETAAQEGSETLVAIDTTYSELLQAKEALTDFNFDIRNLGNAVEVARQAVDHLGGAWAARPDLDSIRRLADVAENATPLVRQVEVLVPRFYGGLLTVADNFASDEIVATLGVMGAALVLAYALGMGVGFWARRGRPGVIARTLQRLGARLFRGWYVRNLPHALSGPLYAAARERIQGDIVADPEKALDPDALRELELYFERRLREDPSA